jgi:hypothetical protein
MRRRSFVHRWPWVALALVATLALSMGSVASGAPAGPLAPKVRPPALSRPPAAEIPSRAHARIEGATRLGFCGGDDWEPEIAADDATHVYVVWAHFVGDPTCDPASANGRDIYIRVSNDGGKTFGPSHVVVHTPYPNVVDCVVTVSDQGVVYVSFLAYGLPGQPATASDVVVARSIDFGETFTWTKINGPGCSKCDHPWPVARGNDVYVAYSEVGRHWLSHSSDGGATWTETLLRSDTHVPFAEGGVLDAAGNAWFAWGDCSGSCTGRKAASYRVSRTRAGSSATVFADVASGPSGPDCPYNSCGFGYFGPQDDIAIDVAGNLYLVWQDGQDHQKPKSPPIVQLSRCAAAADCTRSANWHYVGRVDDKTASGCALSACFALFPRIEGGAANRVAVVWMDDRNGGPIDHTNGWNVWYRTSTNGGSSWTGPGARVSAYDPSRPESQPNGFKFPYGDYQGIDLTPSGRAVMIWGEGTDYDGGPSKPGHVIFARLPD